MKFLIVALVAVAFAAAVTVEEQWEKYKIDFNRSFTAEENAERFEIFKVKLDEIAEHNKKFDKGEVSWSMGINNFTDLKPEERQIFGGGGLIVPKIPDESDEDNSSEEDDVVAKWEDFKKKFNRNYDSSEDAERIKIFKKTLERIAEHNKKFDKGEVGWSMGINQFADRKPAEKKGSLGLVQRPESVKIMNA